MANRTLIGRPVDWRALWPTSGQASHEIPGRPIVDPAAELDGCPNDCQLATIGAAAAAFAHVTAAVAVGGRSVVDG